MSSDNHKNMTKDSVAYGQPSDSSHDANTMVLKQGPTLHSLKLILCKALFRGYSPFWVWFGSWKNAI